MLARLGIVGGLWTLLNVYVGGHVLAPAGLSGLPRILAWGAVLLVAWLPLVALATARRATEDGRKRGPLMRILDWAAYTAMGLSSLLIVSFIVIDLLRLNYERLTTLAGGRSIMAPTPSPSFGG